MSPLRRLSLTVLFATPVLAAAAGLPFKIQLQAGVEHDSNVNNNPWDEYQLPDTGYTATLKGEQPRVLSREVLLTWGWELETKQWREHPGLGTVSGGLNAALRWKRGLGPTAPAVVLDFSLDEIGQRVSSFGGERLEAGLTFVHRPADWIRYTLGVREDHLQAKEPFYSRSGWTNAATISVTLLPSLVLELGCSQRIGGLLFFNEPPEEDQDYYLHEIPWKWSPLFPEATWAYRATGKTRCAHATLRYSLTARHTLQLGYEASDSTYDEISYPKRRITLGLVHRF